MESSNQNKMDRNNIGWLLLRGDTRLIRFFVALIDLSFISYLYADWNNPSFGELRKISFVMWSMGLTLHSLALLWGLSGSYNLFTLLIEGVLGWVIWVAVAVTNWTAQGGPGPSLVMAIIVTWLLARYPKNIFQWGKRDNE